MSEEHLSPERGGRITGSRIGKVLDLSPYGDPDTVMREMVRQAHGAPEEFKGNWATERGQRLEPAAIRVYETTWRVLLRSEQRFVTHPKYDWLGVTPEGLVGDEGVVEVKCPPPSARYTRVDERPDYGAQLRLEIACLGAEWGDLAVYKPDPSLPEEVDQPDRLFTSRVLADDWLEQQMPVLVEFRERYLTIVTSKRLSAPYLTDLSVPVDPWFSRAEVDYAEAMATLTAAKAEVDACYAALVEQSKGETTRGQYYQVIHSTRKGSIDYKAALAHYAPGREGADLEPFRGPGKDDVVTVRSVGKK
jgi:YqaJ-like viral recombinase domain